MLIQVISHTYVTLEPQAYVISGFIDPGFVPYSEKTYFVPLGIGVIFLCIMMIFMLLSFMYMDLEHGALSDLSFSYVHFHFTHSVHSIYKKKK